ncbi:hypothetical protein O6H91_18G030100 [Diphasiastrum complanatum]|uniref:Uncharacterized protein n=1 Tax=Diphasiastrum complanatum TaxID=34168 RepID=A0ACC2AZH0_DIPCM|nr:hypothetical protein O6H91_18G030100 [Diphasiastrum complanatum]
MGSFGISAVGMIFRKDVASKKKELISVEVCKSIKENQEEMGSSWKHVESQNTAKKRQLCVGELEASTINEEPFQCSKNMTTIGDSKSDDSTGKGFSALTKAMGWESSNLASSLRLHRIKTRSGPLLDSIRQGDCDNLDNACDSGKLNKFSDWKSNKNGAKRFFSDGLLGKSVRKGHVLKAFLHSKGSADGPSGLDLDNSRGFVNESCQSGVNASTMEDVSKMMETYLRDSSIAASQDMQSPGINSSKEYPGAQFMQYEELSSSSWIDVESNFASLSTGTPSFNKGPVVDNPCRTSSSVQEFSVDKKIIGWCASNDDVNSSGHYAGRLNCEQNLSNQSEAIKDTDSPRFQALLRMTAGRRKYDIKSFSHELDPRGVRSHLYWRPHSFNDLEEVLGALRARFNTAKEEVNTELAVFAGDLVEILEKSEDTLSEWKEKIEDLLILARQSAMMSSVEFCQQCETIVQDLDDRRQDLPMGILKQLHTRMLFILTRCTRLVQFQKESGLDAAHSVGTDSLSSKISSRVECPDSPMAIKKGKAVMNQKNGQARPSARFYSQELKAYPWKGKDTSVSSQRVHPEDAHASPKGWGLDMSAISMHDSMASNNVNSLISSRLASWKKFTISSEQKSGGHGSSESVASHVKQLHDLKASDRFTIPPNQDDGSAVLQELPSKDFIRPVSRHLRKATWSHWGEHGSNSEDIKLVCRICEEEVPTLLLEEHSSVCALADRCDYKGLSLDERFIRIAETLEKMLESSTPKSVQLASGWSPETIKTLSIKRGSEGSEGVSPRLSDLPRRGSEEMLEDLHEMDAASLEDLRGFSTNHHKTRFGPRSDLGLSVSSTGSRTPGSLVATPRTSQMDLLLAEKCFIEMEDVCQINELADIARCVANKNVSEGDALDYLISCMQDLQDVLQHRKVEARTVDTFGKRIEKLLREKYLLICETLERNSADTINNILEDDGALEDDVFQSLKSTPMHLVDKDRTSIDDFEIIKPISRGAFGRVFLARKRTTGDIFAIKVLRKADMIRKNAVESVHAERNILISARNPFVVRFFYSFTCRENLYLVMEFLNGGDLYSMLRNMGCLEEEMARIYIAELVLALEYLHSLGVIHRDLKPDNVLIAHDGHIKLTDFGLSKVGLINSTDDLSGPAASGNMIMGEDVGCQAVEYSLKRERRQQRSAVGTPDYLAPEILLGTSHGYTADWWSVGVILFEFLIGIPPFNAEHPQIIFDNILNRKIPWPRVPEDLSYEAQDLIGRLLTEDPGQRLGAKGAAEVKAHAFFKDIKWESLARQKAAFIPTSDTTHDTSYFTSRHKWSSADDRVYAENEFPDSSDYESSSDSSNCLSSRLEEGNNFGDTGSSPATYTFNNFSFKNLSQLATINYDLLIQSSKDISKAL